MLCRQKNVLLMISMKPCIAHVSVERQRIQTLEDHLNEVALLASHFGRKVGLEQCGRLLGLIHDLGKYSQEFQIYIEEVTGLRGEEFIQIGEAKRGLIDHATSGAQIIWDAVESYNLPIVVAQILSVVIMSHHSKSGMKDFLNLQGDSPFLDRLRGAEERTHKEEAWTNCKTIYLRGMLMHSLPDFYSAAYWMPTE